MEKFYSPRWLHEYVNIGAGIDVRGPSQYFANNEIWDWHLVYLSVVGTAETTTSPYSSTLGGVARRMRFKVGISQQGDINLVESNGHAMFGPDRSYIVHSNDLNAGAAFRFDPEKPYRLPPDSGIGGIVKNNDETYNIDNLGCLFMGYEEPDGPGGLRNPVHFGGFGYDELQPGTDGILDHADLFNDGRHSATLTDMVLQGFALNSRLQFILMKSFLIIPILMI